MRIDEFLRSSRRFDLVGAPEMDALREDAALDEAGLLEVRVNVVDSSAWLLFDCRGALQVRAGYTGIIVLKSIQQLEWSCPSNRSLSWRYVLGWKPAVHGDSFTVEFFAGDDGNFRATALAGEFYVGSVPGDDEAPPNLLHATDEEILEGFAQWDSPFTAIRASFIDTSGG